MQSDEKVSYFLGSWASPLGSDAVLEAAEDCMDPPVCNNPDEAHCQSEHLRRQA